MEKQTVFAATICLVLVAAGTAWTSDSNAAPGMALRTLRGMTVHQTLSLCDRKPSTQRRTWVRGYFVLTALEHGGAPFGRLYDKRVPNTLGVGAGDSTPYLPVGWRQHGNTWIPSGHWVMVYGRLNCSDPGYVVILRVEKWKRWVKHWVRVVSQIKKPAGS